ncbi:MAG: 7,8-didemethyl-8-hydroxy-5-deazariboflavin synthase subunit CofH [Methanosarcinales archaeon]|nr:MAG: 7,8-didemethyl-8-hydroxy-5-deazariboflavin synthase subunit CofH [Methanosarcinales archaeon]
MLHIRHVFENALAGSITYDDAIHLFTECKPSTLFALADNLRKMTCGDVVTYIVNRNINFTNICIGSCKFCAFRRENGYRLSIEEIIAKAREAVDVGASEICIQGGLLDDMYIEDYCKILKNVKSEFPHLHLHAYSPMEVFHAAHTSNISIKTALSKLKQSGLDSMPGTAAEIFSKRVRSIICPEKLSAEDWLTVVRSAHEMGIRTTATMMYGHIETIEERIEHMLAIRELQKKTGGFTEFVPLLFMPHNNALGKITNKDRDKLDDLKVHAIARIIFHTHINNIQTSWVKLGIKDAQDILLCGANDLGGTLMEEKISRSAGAVNGEYITPKEFNTLIKNVNRQPAIRNTLYTSTSLQ